MDRRINREWLVLRADRTFANGVHRPTDKGRADVAFEARGSQGGGRTTFVVDHTPEGYRSTGRISCRRCKRRLPIGYRQLVDLAESAIGHQVPAVYA